MPEPHELIIVYDGANPFYTHMLLDVGNPRHIIDNPSGRSRFELINDALLLAKGELIMHVESDFYWVDESCLTDAVEAMRVDPEISFIRFELLPFTQHSFNRFTQSGGHDILYMKPSAPYRFSFNPHIRRFKWVNGKPFPPPPYNKQPEQIFGEEYSGLSCCMSGDNFRHLGVFDEGGHYKDYYGERFFNKRGKKIADIDDYVTEFEGLTGNEKYRKLFRGYLALNPAPPL